MIPATPTVTAAGGTYVYNGGPRAATGTAKGVFNEDLGPLTFTYNGAAQAVNAARLRRRRHLQRHIALRHGVGEYVADHHAGDADRGDHQRHVHLRRRAAHGGVGGDRRDRRKPRPAGADLHAGVLARRCTRSYAVAGTFAGNTNYISKTAPNGTLTITPATPAIVVTGGTFTYDGAAHPASAVATGALGDVIPLTFTYNGSPALPINAGTYTVVASSPVLPDYAAAQKTGTIVINPATPTIAVSGGPFTYDGAAHGAIGTVTGVNGEALGAAALTYNGDPSAPINASTYAVAASFPAGGNYTAATGAGSLTILPATPLVP